MSARWYRQGLASVTNGSRIVTGNGSIWSSQAEPGDVFMLDKSGADFYEVAAVNSDTELELYNPFGGATEVDQDYAIIRNFASTLSSQVAADMAALIQATRNRELEMQRWLAGTVNGGPNNDGYYPMTKLDGTTQLVPCPALIVPPTTPEEKVQNGQLSKTLYSPAGAVASLDLGQAAVHHLVLDQPDCTISLTNAAGDPTVAQHIALVLEQGTGGNSVTWPINIRWNQGMVPVLSSVAGYRDTIDLFTTNNGGIWFGFYSGTGIA